MFYKEKFEKFLIKIVAENKNGIDIYFKKRKTNFYHNNYFQSINYDNLKINFEKFDLWENIWKINIYLK